MNISSIIGILCFASLVTIIIVVPLLLKEIKKQNEAKQRRNQYAPNKNFIIKASENNDERRKKMIYSKLKALANDRKYSESNLGKIMPMLQKAGIKMSIAPFCFSCISLGVFGYLLLNYIGYPLLGIPGFFVFTFLFPYFFLKKKAQSRQKKFTKYFGSALEIIVRGLRSGMPPQECFRHIGQEVPDPCGEIFKQIMSDVQMGIPLSDSIENAYIKMPTTELKFFSCVISIQQQTGGNLSEILGNIAEVIRGRAALKEKAKAMSSEAKMSSIIVGALPFLVCGLLTFVDYNYISLLWRTFTGKCILSAAACSMSMGLFIMNRMSKIDS